MKKRVLLFLPVLTILTSCAVFSIGFSEGEHEAGLENGDALSSKRYVDDYSFFAGDNISPEGKDTAIITFANYDDSLDIHSPEDLDPYVACNIDGIFKKTNSINNVAINKDKGVFVGATSTLADGALTLSFNVDVKDVVIDACPYYYEENKYNQTTLKIDEGVCVSVNTKPYILLSSTKNEDGASVKETECRFHLTEASADVKIKVGIRKAFINKITIYY